MRAATSGVHSFDASPVIATEQTSGVGERAATGVGVRVGGTGVRVNVGYGDGVGVNVGAGGGAVATS